MHTFYLGKSLLHKSFLYKRSAFTFKLLRLLCQSEDDNVKSTKLTFDILKQGSNSQVCTNVSNTQGLPVGGGDVEVFDWSAHKVHAPFIYAFSINRFLIFNELRSSKPFHKRTFWALHNYTLLNIRTIVQNYTPTPALIRVVTKISSCRVNTTSRRRIKQLGISLGAIFLLFSSESYRLLMTVLTNTV